MLVMKYRKIIVKRNDENLVRKYNKGLKRKLWGVDIKTPSV